MRTETVTSAQNPKIKDLLALGYKSRLRREKGLFLVEGRREVEHCLDAGFQARTIYSCPEILDDKDFNVIAQKASSGNPKCTCVQVPQELYAKISYREDTEGVIAEVIWKERNLEDIQLASSDGTAKPHAPLVIVLEAVEKPGNLGAVLRSADAAGADAILICDPLTDLYNPNLIRASVGAVFSRQVVVTSNEEALKWLKDNKIKIYSAQLQDSHWYYDTDMKGATAIVMGTESTGLTDFWRDNADAHIKIPMLGELDSLNVSVSAAILLFEAVRQRESR